MVLIEYHLGQRQVFMALLSVLGKHYEGEKLSNSGDTLKLMIPNYSRKIISGQHNYLGMVTSYMMNESEMGYRGSKSILVLNTNIVKEQRVDGSYCLNLQLRQLRCTLMGFERNYQVRIPSNQLNKLNFSTVSVSNTVLKPYFCHRFFRC